MKIKWLGHSSFLISSDTGIKIITDPYTPGIMGLNYGEIKESADIVTVSHEHGDHNDVAAIQGNPKIIKDATTWVIPAAIFEASYAKSRTPGLHEDKEQISNIRFNAISTYHDNAGGQQRGKNTIFCFEVDGIKLCHLGDLGHPLSGKQVADIGKVDIVLTPVGGNFTIDARVATEVCNKLKAKVIIPMHYQNERCPGFQVAEVDGFLQGKAGVNRADGSEVEYKQAELPATTQIIVLQPAL